MKKNDQPIKINVLGQDYTVFIRTTKDDERLNKFDGYNVPEKKIIVLDAHNSPKHQEHVLTHELVHSFLYESGLDAESWASNEEIVDWIAIQLFKMNDTIKAAKKQLQNKIQSEIKKNT